MKYSIITINYNNKKGLEKTIKSVINQTFKDFEYIIIDGGSTDGSIEVINRYAEKINYWVSEPDKGIYNAMNKGISKATGEYLNFMNSGDSFHSPSVLDDVTEMQLKEDIITGGFYDIEKKKPHIIRPQNVTLLTMLKETFNHQSTFFKKELFANNMYDESYKIQSDAKFNLQSIIINNCSIRIIDYIIADYDFNGISSNKDIVKKERKRMLEELFPPRVLKDYEQMFTSGEVSLVKLLPELKNSPSIQRFLYKIASLLLSFKHIIK